jgi:hypothetical protein
MGSATLEVSGPDAARWAADLHADLTAQAEPSESVSPVEVQRSGELVIAAIGLVFSGITTATAIWDWWQSRRARDAKVTILFSSGTRVDLSNIDHDELQIIFRRAGSQS